MDLEYVKELIEILEKSGLNKLKIREKNGVEVTLEKNAVQTYPSNVKCESVVALPEKSNILQRSIKSPMVGTFYSSESPDVKHFVKQGDEICKGDTLCIIEAMKVMNEIKSDLDGIIKEVLIGNGRPVEYGQLLFTIE